MDELRELSGDQLAGRFHGLGKLNRNKIFRREIQRTENLKGAEVVVVVVVV